MPTLSASNRSQLAIKLEGVYPTNWGVAQGGNGKFMNMTGESLDYTIKNEQSKQIRSDRQVQDVVQVSASAQGGINFEHQYKEYDALLEGAVQGVFTAYGTGGISAAMTGTLAMTSTTVLTASVATAGADGFAANLNKGQWVSLIPAAGESDAVKAYLAGRAFRLSATVGPTNTVLTLDAATPINTAIVTAPLMIGWKVSSSRMTNGTTMKSYSIEVQHQDISQYRQYLGMIPSKMSVKLSVGSIVTGSFEFIGKAMTLAQATNQGAPTAAQAFTPANATRGIFDIFENGASISATTYIKSGEFNLDNTLRAQDAVGVFGSAGVGVGTFKAGGKLEVYFADAVMYQKLISGAASSLTIPILDVAGNGYIYVFPRIKYTAAKVAVGGLDQDNMLSMDWEALLDIDPLSPTYGFTVAVYRVGV